MTVETSANYEIELLLYEFDRFKIQATAQCVLRQCAVENIQSCVNGRGRSICTIVVMHYSSDLNFFDY